MPISTKLIAVAASAAVLVTGAGVAINATTSQPATVATIAQPVVLTTEVRVWADNTTYSISLPTPTVTEALAAAGITLGEQDRVTPELSATLATGDTVTVSRVATTRETKVVTLDFPTTEVKDSKLAKGERKVTTKGVNGTREDVIETVTINGQVESTTTLSETVTLEPVTQVVRVGTKVAPKVTSRSTDRTTPAKTATKTTAPKTTAPKATAPKTEKKAEPAPAPRGGALDLSRAAMWDRIAKCESTNRWNINTGNGYYGGLQFSLSTWRSVGGTDFAAYPHQATREEQITVANRLYAKRGLQPWGCRHAA